MKDKSCVFETPNKYVRWKIIYEDGDDFQHTVLPYGSSLDEKWDTDLYAGKHGNTEQFGNELLHLTDIHSTKLTRYG